MEKYFKIFILEAEMCGNVFFRDEDQEKKRFFERKKYQFFFFSFWKIVELSNFQEFKHIQKLPYKNGAYFHILAALWLLFSTDTSKISGKPR